MIAFEYTLTTHSLSKLFSNDSGDSLSHFDIAATVYSGKNRTLDSIVPMNKWDASFGYIFFEGAFFGGKRNSKKAINTAYVAPSSVRDWKRDRPTNGRTHALLESLCCDYNREGARTFIQQKTDWMKNMTDHRNGWKIEWLANGCSHIKKTHQHITHLILKRQQIGNV